VNWNDPGLTNVPIRRLAYERATSCAEVEAHRVHVLCEYTRTRWLGPFGTAGPSELPLTFSVYWWLMRTVVGVTVTSRLDADAGTAKTSRPTVASNPTSERFRCERPDEARPAIEALMLAEGPALLEAVVDPFEPPMPPSASPKQALHLAESLIRGQPHAGKIAVTLYRDKRKDAIKRVIANMTVGKGTYADLSLIGDSS